ncbi:MAG: hypothetical protein AAF570_22585, partial [Bacteroidota bacterium]
MLLFSLTTLSSFAQTFLEVPEHHRPMKFGEFQRALHDWGKDKDLKGEKGWKWLKRWEAYQAQRMNPDGTTYDPAVYAMEMEKVATMKAARKKAATTSWQPFGPSDYATPASSGWEPG